MASCNGGRSTSSRNILSWYETEPPALREGSKEWRGFINSIRASRKCFRGKVLSPNLPAVFYRAMHFSAKRGIAIVYCPSVCPSICLSVTFRYRDHIGWNSSKIIWRPNSLRPLLWLTPTLAIWCTFIRSITTTVINNFGKSSRGRSQGLPKIFRASIGCIARSSLR